MNRWQKSLIAVFVFLVGLVLFAYILPNRWQVERSILIAASRTSIFSYINNLQQWPSWTYFSEDHDNTAQISFHGPSSGIGASLYWAGEKLGDGKLTITESNPETGVRYAMQIQGFYPAIFGKISLITTTQGTKVIWKDQGELGNNPVNRYFGLLLEPTLGVGLEKSLAKLKEIVETESRK